MNKKLNVKNNKTITTEHWLKENCLQYLQQKRKEQCLKAERWWTMKSKKYKTEHQVKEVKISTILYSFNHWQKWKFFQQQLFWSMIICLLTVTVLHYNSCAILFLHIFHKSAFETVLQLSGFLIWKVNSSLEESSWEFWCNVTLNNCMSIKKQTSCNNYCNWSTGIGIGNETQLICQYSIVPSQQFKIVMWKAKFFRIFIK